MKSSVCFSDIAFPEALRWHKGDLWFSDVLTGKVYRGVVATGELHQEAHIPPLVSGLGWTSGGDLLAVDCEKRQVIHFDKSGSSVVFADLSKEWLFPANDMLVDPDGTIWIGTYGFNPNIDKPISASLGRIRNGILDFPVAGLVFANGISRIDENRIIVSETFADRISIIQSRGEIFVEKQIQLPEGSTPDGVVVDNQGHAWIASAYSGAVLRVNLITGDIERAIEIPKRGVYDCTFGGDNLDKLFVAVSDIDETNTLRDLPGQILSFDLSSSFPGIRGMGNK